MYEEKIERNPPISYSLFHLQALLLFSQIAENNYSEDIWNLKGSTGAGIEDSLDRYSEYILGENTNFPPPDTDTISNLQSGYAWIYEIAYNKWGKSRFLQIAETGDRNKFIRQSIGPVTLFFAK